MIVKAGIVRTQDFVSAPNGIGVMVPTGKGGFRELFELSLIELEIEARLEFPSGRSFFYELGGKDAYPMNFRRTDTCFN